MYGMACVGGGRRGKGGEEERFRNCDNELM